MRLSPNAKLVMERHYLKRDSNRNIIETPEECLRRVANCVASVEKNKQLRDEYEEAFFNLMNDRLLSGNSPCYTGAGREKPLMHACFVLPVEDSIDSIFNAIRAGALVHKEGGGTGYNFGDIREEDALVKSSNGLSSGPLSFMKVFDIATETIKQGSTRRGANMGVLPINHPDILKFIRCKDVCDPCPSCKTDPPYSNFNLSVAVTDAFMEALDHGVKDFPLISPGSKEVRHVVDPQFIWDTIIKQTWSNGEPGIIFIDSINRYNPVPGLGNISATNPCVVGNTRILTSEGFVRIKDIADLQENVIPEIAIDLRTCGNSISRHVYGNALIKPNWIRKTGHSVPVFRVITEHGYELIATRYHRFIMSDMSFKELKDLVIGDKLCINAGVPLANNPHNIGISTEGELSLVAGWLAGDGHISGGRASLNFYGDKKVLASKFNDYVSAIIPAKGNNGVTYNSLSLLHTKQSDRIQVRSERLALHLETLGINKDTRQVVPEFVWKGCHTTVANYLTALFSADGTVNVSSHKKSCSVRLSQSNEAFLKEVQILLTRFGIVSSIKLRRHAHEKYMPDSKGGSKLYKCKAQYELIIDGECRDLFSKYIGFILKYKQDKLEEFISSKSRNSNKNSYTTKIVSITPVGNEDVYCINEPITHSMVVNGLVTLQCGEVPLLSYEACLLASINLAEHLGPSGNTTPELLDFDYTKLANTVKLGIRFLDNIVDISQYPLPEITETVKKTRKLGLGVMGWADALIKMRIPYASDEAIALAEKVMSYIDKIAFEASCELAVEKGEMPAIDQSIWKDAPKGKRPRNATRTCIAPTGTISKVFDCSSGIEPLFGLSYTKHLYGGDKMKVINDDFMTILESIGLISNTELLSKIKEDGIVGHMPEIPEDVKKLFACAVEIPGEWHIKMQAAFQKHINNAVSKTINLPYTASIEDVKSIYTMAYKYGLKGLTIYRTDSRTTQVMTLGTNNKEDIPDTGGDGILIKREGQVEEVPVKQYNESMRKRESTLIGKTYKMVTGCGNLYVTINHDEVGPAEIFLNMGDSGGCAMAWAQALGKALSLFMRTGFDPRDLIPKYNPIRCPEAAFGPDGKINSCPHAIAIVLQKEFGENGKQRTTKTVRNQCPKCGGVMRTQSGCATCEDCGEERCG